MEHSKPIKHGTKEGITHLVPKAKSEALKKKKHFHDKKEKREVAGEFGKPMKD